MSDEIAITIDTSIHDLEAIKRTCYALGAKCSVQLDRVDETHVVARCTSISGEVLAVDFSSEFNRTLVDFGVRHSLALETAEIRDLIFRQAFVEADL